MPEDKPLQDALVGLALDIAQRRLRAAGRFQPADPTQEKPRVVTTAFVASVAEQLIAGGLPTRVVASRREIKITRGDLDFAYGFQASFDNTAGATIVLWPHAEVRSRALRARRQAQGEKPDPLWNSGNVVIRGMLGNFFAPRRIVELELIDPASRAALARETVAAICDVDARLQRAFADQDSFFAFAHAPDTEIVRMGCNTRGYIGARWGEEAEADYVAYLRENRCR